MRIAVLRTARLPLLRVWSAAVGLLVAPQSMLLISMVVYILLLVSRFVVAKRRGTLPEHMLVADEEPAETAETPEAPGHPGASAR